MISTVVQTMMVTVLGAMLISAAAASLCAADTRPGYSGYKIHIDVYAVPC